MNNSKTILNIPLVWIVPESCGYCAQVFHIYCLFLKAALTMKFDSLYFSPWLEKVLLFTTCEIIAIPSFHTHAMCCGCPFGRCFGSLVKCPCSAVGWWWCVMVWFCGDVIWFVMRRWLAVLDEALEVLVPVRRWKCWYQLATEPPGAAHSKSPIHLRGEICI